MSHKLYRGEEELIQSQIERLWPKLALTIDTDATELTEAGE